MISNTATHTVKAHRGAINTLVFDAKRKYVVSGGADKTLRLMNPRKGSVIKTYSGAHGFAVVSVAIAHDNSKMVSAGDDKRLFEWDVSTGSVIRRLSGHTRRVGCVAYGGESSWLASGGNDQHVRLWDMRARGGRAMQVLADARDAVSGLVLSAQEIVASSVDGSVRTYDVRMGALRTDTLGVPIGALNVTNDGFCLLASCTDNTLRLLDTESGQMLQEYRGHVNRNFRVAACALPDDSHVLSGSENGEIVLWDLVEGDVVQRVKAHSKHVTGLVVARNGDNAIMVVSSSANGQVKTWL